MAVKSSDFQKGFGHERRVSIWKGEMASKESPTNG